MPTFNFVPSSTFLGNIGEDLDYGQHDEEDEGGIHEDADAEGISDATRPADYPED